jgi:hypothetical protein
MERFEDSHENEPGGGTRYAEHDFLFATGSEELNAGSHEDNLILDWMRNQDWPVRILTLVAVALASHLLFVLILFVVIMTA